MSSISSIRARRVKTVACPCRSGRLRCTSWASSEARPGTYAVHNLETWPSWTGAIVEALIGRDANEPVWLGIRNLWSVDPDRALRRAAEAYPEGANARSWILEGWMRRRADILRLIVQSPHRPLPGWARQWLAEHLRDIPGHGADQIYELIAGST